MIKMQEHLFRKAASFRNMDDEVLNLALEQSTKDITAKKREAVILEEVEEKSSDYHLEELIAERVITESQREAEMRSKNRMKSKLSYDFDTETALQLSLVEHMTTNTSSDTFAAATRRTQYSQEKSLHKNTNSSTLFDVETEKAIQHSIEEARLQELQIQEQQRVLLEKQQAQSQKLQMAAAASRRPNHKSDR
jgi:hypothetical protein